MGSASKLPPTLVESLQSIILARPDEAAFLSQDAAISFSQFGRMIAAVAGRLSREGTVRGDRIVICAPNSVHWAAAYFAVHAVGCVVVPLDFDASSETTARIFDEVRPRLALSAKNLVIHAPVISLLAACDAAAVEPFAKPACSPDDAADILRTTGTTDRGKNVVLTHRQIRAAATNINAFIGSRAGDIEVVPLPLSHSFGLGRLRCMAQTGATLAIESGMQNAARLLKHVLDFRATGLALVPAGFEILLRMTGDRLSDARSHLRYVEIGSAPMRIETKRHLMELLPNARICHHYGLTEASRAAFIEYHADAERLESIGRAGPNVEIAVRDEFGRDCPPGQHGEILVRGEMVMKEYWQQPEQTAQALRNGWLHTGDLGFKDADGFLHLVGRRADVINVAGLKVSPEEVEARINSHPAVVESACIAAPDPQNMTGECVQAFLVTRRPVSDVELVAWLRPHLEEYKIPRLWRRVEKIPKTDSGKIQRRSLS